MKIGSLFSGVAGLDRAVEEFFDADVAWFVEYEAAPSKVLAYHYPGVPNYGDVTTVDWATVEPVDILTGGFPCQDVSLAGARRGLKDGTRSGLWSEYAKAIDILRPRLVVIENVRGLLSAEAHRPMEPDTGALGDGTDGPVLRALGAVLGDLAELGYDTEWCGVRASDAGAPHGRFRVFIIAYPKGQPWRVWDGDDVSARRGTVGRAPDTRGSATQDTDVATRDQRGQSTPGQAKGRRSRPDAGGRSGTLTAHPRGDEPERWGSARVVGGTPPTGETDGEERERVRDTVGDSGTTPADTYGSGRIEHGRTIPVRPEHAAVEHGSATDWGVYTPAIRRWETVTGRTAPAPTIADGKNGQHRLSARFVEWMMGWDAGWVTDPAIDLTRNEQLKACGNGVVTQQALLALRILTGRAA